MAKRMNHSTKNWQQRWRKAGLRWKKRFAMKRLTVNTFRMILNQT